MTCCTSFCQPFINGCSSVAIPNTLLFSISCDILSVYIAISICSISLSILLMRMHVKWKMISRALKIHNSIRAWCFLCGIAHCNQEDKHSPPYAIEALLLVDFRAFIAKQSKKKIFFLLHLCYCCLMFSQVVRSRLFTCHLFSFYCSIATQQTEGTNKCAVVCLMFSAVLLYVSPYVFCTDIQSKMQY